MGTAGGNCYVNPSDTCCDTVEFCEAQCANGQCVPFECSAGKYKCEADQQEPTTPCPDEMPLVGRACPGRDVLAVHPCKYEPFTCPGASAEEMIYLTEANCTDELTWRVKSHMVDCGDTAITAAPTPAPPGDGMQPAVSAVSAVCSLQCLLWTLVLA